MKNKKLFDATKEAKEVNVNRIKLRAPFRDLFPVDDEKVKIIAAHMKEHGFDKSQPVTLWDASTGRGPHDLVLLDGHQRLLAAGLVPLSMVWAVVVKFPSEDAALQYSIHCQRNRRNLSEGDVLTCVEELHSRKAPEPKNNLAQGCAKPSGKSAAETAKKLPGKVSTRKVEQALTVLKDEEKKAEVKAGKKTINKAYTEIKGATPVVGAEPKPKTETATQDRPSLPLFKDEELPGKQEPKTATYVKAHFLCPYCQHKIFEDEIKLIDKPDKETQAMVH